jgi:hypothetical protein
MKNVFCLLRLEFQFIVFLPSLSFFRHIFIRQKYHSPFFELKTPNIFKGENDTEIQDRIYGRRGELIIGNT